MAELIRIGMVLDSAGVVRGAREATQALGQVRQAASQTVLTGDRLVDNFNSLRTQFQRGAITVQQYRDQLRTTRADLQSFTNTTRLSAEQERYFATQAGAMTTALRAVEGQALRTQNAMVRVSGGIQTLVFSMQGARLSAMGLLSALGTLGIGSGGFIAVMAVLGAIAAVLLSIKDNADDAAAALSNTARAMGSLREDQLQTAISRLEGIQTAAAHVIKFRGVDVTLPGGRPLTAEEATQLTEARAALAALRRRPTTTRAPSRDDLVGDPRFGGFTGAPTPTDFKPDAGKSLLGAPGGMTMVDELKKTAKGFAGARDEILDIGSTLVSGLSAVGASLADGFKGIGKAILGIIGGMMQQIGHALVMFGLAGKAIRNFIKNPALAVAVGAGLIVLGAALAKSAQGVVNRGGEGGASASVGPQFSGASDSARGATIVQIIGQTSGEVIAQHTYENARYRNRGGSAPNTSQSAMTIPVTGQVVVRRV